MHPFYGQELIFFLFTILVAKLQICVHICMCAHIYWKKTRLMQWLHLLSLHTHTQKICCLLVCLLDFIFANQTTKMTIKIIKKKNLAIFWNSGDIFTISLIQEVWKIGNKKENRKEIFYSKSYLLIQKTSKHLIMDILATLTSVWVI